MSYAAEPCDWSAGAHRVTTVLGGVTASQPRPNSSNVGGVSTGQGGHNSSIIINIALRLSDAIWLLKCMANKWTWLSSHLNNLSGNGGSHVVSATDRRRT